MGKVLDKDGLTVPKITTDLVEIGEGNLLINDSGNLVINDSELIIPDLSGYVTKAYGEISTKLTVTAGRDAIFRKNGARVYLCSFDDTELPGNFILRCPKNESCTEYVDLKGRPDGLLTWDNHRVMTKIAEWRSDKNWYRKYSDGWIEQGGVISVSSYNDSGSFTFNQPFKDSNYTITSGQARGNEAGQGTLSFYSLNAASFSYKVSAGQAYYNDKYHWFACGY